MCTLLARGIYFILTKLLDQPKESTAYIKTAGTLEHYLTLAWLRPVSDLSTMARDILTGVFLTMMARRGLVALPERCRVKRCVRVKGIDFKDMMMCSRCQDVLYCSAECQAW